MVILLFYVFLTIYPILQATHLGPKMNWLPAHTPYHIPLCGIFKESWLWIFKNPIIQIYCQAQFQLAVLVKFSWTETALLSQSDQPASHPPTPEHLKETMYSKK